MRPKVMFLPEIYLLVRSDSQTAADLVFRLFGCSRDALPQNETASASSKVEERRAEAVSKVFRTTAKIGGFMPAADDDANANHHRLVHSSISGLQYPRQCSANFAPLAPACKVSRLLHHLNPATLSFLAPILSVVSESLPISKHERIFAFTDKKIPFLH